MLVDVNVCLALSSQQHEHHTAVRAWFDEVADDAIGICRVVQLGWLRLLSARVVLGEEALSRRQAWGHVDAMMRDARFVYLEEPPGLDERFRELSAREDRSHKLWTDDYLAAFAAAGDLELITLDTKLSRRYPDLTVLTLG